MTAVMADQGLGGQANISGGISGGQATSAARQWMRRGFVVAMAMLVAACQTVVPKGPPTTPTSPEGPVTPGLPTDTQRHRIALLVPQTGPHADVGEVLANATMMAILDSNTDKLRITTYDTGAGAAAAARRAVADGNKLILGPLLAEDVSAVGPIARAAGVPIISFSNDTAVAGNGVYLLGYVPNQSVTRVVQFARSKGLNRFSAIAPQGAYGDRALAALRTAVAANGGTMVATESYDRSAASITGAIRRLSRTGSYDALLIADGAKVAVQAAPLVRSQSSKTAKILGTELWNTESQLAGTPALRGAWFASVPDQYYSTLATKYRQRYGKNPYRIASLGYDAVLLTIKMSRNWKPGTRFPVNNLNAADGFGGIDGIFRFDRRGIADRALEVTEIRAGGFTTVSPAPTQW